MLKKNGVRVDMLAKTKVFSFFWLVKGGRAWHNARWYAQGNHITITTFGDAGNIFVRICFFVFVSSRVTICLPHKVGGSAVERLS